MPNDFLITYKDTANFNQITAVQKALEKIGPGPVVLNTDDNCFNATLNWGTTGKDLGNLRGNLNKAADIVIGVQQDFAQESAVNSNLWNKVFTDMIRQTTQTAWGNWTLNPSVVPGDVGILNPETGSYTH
ncbi:MAG: hypothetical protein WBP41_08200, partial [Saprospiraceae bacterium]